MSTDIEIIYERKELTTKDKIQQLIETLKQMLEDSVDTEHYDIDIAIVYKENMIKIESKRIFDLKYRGRSRKADIKLKDNYLYGALFNHNKAIIEKVLKDKTNKNILVKNLIVIENYKIKESYENLNQKEAEEIENKTFDIDLNKLNGLKLLLIHYSTRDKRYHNNKIDNYITHIERVEFVEISYERERKKDPIMKAFEFEINTAVRKNIIPFYVYIINENVNIADIKYVLNSFVDVSKYHPDEIEDDENFGIYPDKTEIKPLDPSKYTFELIAPYPDINKYIDKVMTLKELEKIPDSIKHDGETIINKLSIIFPNTQKLKERLEEDYIKYKKHIENMINQINNAVVKYNIISIANYPSGNIGITIQNGKELTDIFIPSGISIPFKIELN